MSKANLIKATALFFAENLKRENNREVETDSKDKKALYQLKNPHVVKILTQTELLNSEEMQKRTKEIQTANF